MENMDPFIELFVFALRYEIEHNWQRQQYLLAENAGVSSSYISEILKNNKTPSYSVRQAIARACGYTYTEFINRGAAIKKGGNPDEAEGNMVCAPEAAYGPGGDVVSLNNAQHHKIIDRFSDTETAMEVNQILLEIEQMDLRSFYKIVGWLQGKREEVAKKTKINCPPATEKTDKKNIGQ